MIRTFRRRPPFDVPFLVSAVKSEIGEFRIRHAVQPWHHRAANGRRGEDTAPYLDRETAFAQLLQCFCASESGFVPKQRESSAHDNQRLRFALRSSHVGVLVELVAQCADGNIEQPRGVCPIAVAAIERREDVTLLQFGERGQFFL